MNDPYPWMKVIPADDKVSTIGKTPVDARMKAKMFHYVCEFDGAHLSSDGKRYCKYWERSTGDRYRCLYCQSAIEDENVPAAFSDPTVRHKVCQLQTKEG